MNLEDIARFGACLQSESHVEPGSDVEIDYCTGFLRGTAKYCVFREFAYFVGVEFAEDSEWPVDQFRPEHLFDPQVLIAAATPPKKT